MSERERMSDQGMTYEEYVRRYGENRVRRIAGRPSDPAALRSVLEAVPMTRERVEQAIEELKATLDSHAHCWHDGHGHGTLGSDEECATLASKEYEALTTLSNALAESEKEKDKAWKLLDLADAKLQGIAALLYPLEEGENEWQALRRITTKLAESEKERERLREALKRLRQEANKDWFNAPDSLCGVIQAITDQALSPDSQEKREE